MAYMGFQPGKAAPAGRPSGPDEPLAPELFARLQKQFGRVEVKKRGESFNYEEFASARPGQIQIRSQGELYYIRCPFCSRPGDGRLRAYVSHFYGQPHPVTGVPMTHLAQCWNENCFSEPGRSDEFELRLLGALATPLAPVSDAIGTPPAPFRPAMPGMCLPLSGLGLKHPAVEYVLGRGFDPDELARDYGASYCLDAKLEYRWALNRLVIPVHQDGKLAGWQARRIDEDKSFKYYSMPGWHAGDQLYNFDAARLGRCVVIAEGVFDVWAVGREGVALFGKDVSPGQMRQLSALVEVEPLVVLLLDPKEDSARGKAHAKLAPLFSDRVLPVVLPLRPPAEDLRAPLPPGQAADAGAMTREAVWARIIAQGDERGIRVEDYL